jgi:hypothetical protein
MIKAYSIQRQVLIQFPDKTMQYRLERRDGSDGPWLALADSGFEPGNDGIVPVALSDMYLDTYLMDGICQYRARNIENDSSEWDYTAWLRRGSAEPFGVTFENYESPDGSWGDIITPDDLRYTYMFGVDFRASNGAPYTDAQIQYFIDAAISQIERQLNITLKKTRIKCVPGRRGLQKGIDYDEEENYYTYSRAKIQRNGMIDLRKRPVLAVSRLDLMSRHNSAHSLLDAYTLDKTKGRITFFNRLPRVDDSYRAVQVAAYPYGSETWERNLLYAIDYTAGYEKADDVPMDLREIIGKQAAVSLLNVIGRGLMSGFSSSSLSMDGVSESFSSTQSATSAYYGADIKEYKDDIEHYIAANKLKFGHIALGAL